MEQEIRQQICKALHNIRDLKSEDIPYSDTQGLLMVEGIKLNNFINLSRLYTKHLIHEELLKLYNNKQTEKETYNNLRHIIYTY